MAFVIGNVGDSLLHHSLQAAVMSCDVAPRVCRSPRAFAILAELAVQSLIDLLEYDRRNAPTVTLWVFLQGGRLSPAL